MGDAQPPSAGRIAIKFGQAATAQKKLTPSHSKPSSALGKRSRSHHVLHGGSDSEPEEEVHGRHEAITTVGSEPASKSVTGSAKDRKDSGQPLVIEGPRNRDWRSRSGAGRRGRPPPADESRQTGVTKDVEQADKAKSVKWGLSTSNGASGKDRTERRGASPSRAERDSKSTQRRATEEKESDRPKDMDQAALDALLGKSPDAEKKKLVIRGNDPGDEDNYAPEVGEVATMADYEAVGTEEFGAALLRGMGWDGKHNSAPHEIKRRPNLMGLGAKEIKGAEELGSWNHKAGKPKPPRLSDYNREEEKKRQRRRERDHERERGR